MRIIWLVASLMAMQAACGHAKECNSNYGIEKNVPAKVIDHMKKSGMYNYQLIDKVTCVNEIYWTAIPSNIPANSPRPPGFSYLVKFNILTNEVKIDKGQ